MASAESSLLPTYDRLQKIKEALDKKIRDTTDRGQQSISHLRTCRPLYFVYKDSYFSSSAPLNEDFKKLVPFPKASKSMVAMPMEELIKMERTLQGLQATQSFSSWLLDVLSKEIKRTNFEPVDPDLFNGINRFLGSSLVESMNLSSSMFAFLRIRRREHFAGDFPASLSESQKKALLSSSLSLDKLFDNDLLLEFAEQVTTQESKSANIQMSRTLPKLTSALVSSSSKYPAQRPSFRQSSSNKNRKSSSARRERGPSSSSRANRDRSPRPQGRSRGSSGRGRSSSRGSGRPNRGSFQSKFKSSEKRPFRR